MFNRKPKINGLPRKPTGLAVLLAMAMSGIERTGYGVGPSHYYPVPNPKNSNAAKQQRAAKKLKAQRARMSKRK